MKPERLTRDAEARSLAAGDDEPVPGMGAVHPLGRVVEFGGPGVGDLFDGEDVHFVAAEEDEEFFF